VLGPTTPSISDHPARQRIIYAVVTHKLPSPVTHHTAMLPIKPLFPSTFLQNLLSTTPLYISTQYTPLNSYPCADILLRIFLFFPSDKTLFSYIFFSPLGLSLLLFLSAIIFFLTCIAFLLALLFFCFFLFVALKLFFSLPCLLLLFVPLHSSL